MKKRIISKLSILLMAICFCSNTWAEEKVTFKFTVRDLGGFYLKNTLVSAVSDTPDKCEISNPTGFVDEQATREMHVTLKGLGTFHITVTFTHTNVTETKTIIITVLEDPETGQWRIQINPNSYEYDFKMQVPHNMTSSSSFLDKLSKMYQRFIKKE